MRTKYKILILFSLVILGGLFFSTQPAKAYIDGCAVSFQASNGQYMVAEGGGGDSVYANRSSISAWEQFRVVNQGGPVALQASNGQYLSADGGGGGGLSADRSAIGGWEQFSMVDAGGGKIALQTSNGYYVVAEGGGGGIVNANRTSIGGWESWGIITGSGCTPTPTATIWADSPSISYSTSTVIRWTSTNTSSCTVSPPGWTSPGAGGWEYTGALYTSTTYTANCTGSNGSVSASVTVTVSGAPPTCSSADNGGVTVAYSNGSAVRVYARGVANADTVWFPTRTATAGGYTWLAGANAGGGTWYADVNPAGFQIGSVVTDVYAYQGSTNQYCGSPSFTSVAPLAASISASPTSIAYGGSSTISWSSTSASTCAIGLYSGSGPTPPGGTGGLSGSWTPTNMTGTTTYFVSCNGVAGGNVGEITTVTVAAAVQATGYLDLANCSSFSGWTWDPDYPDSANSVHIYNNGSFYTAVVAGDYRADLPGNHYHGFTFNVPQAWKDGVNHYIVVYAIDLNGGGNPNLNGSPVNLTCTATTVDLKGNGSDGPVYTNNNTSIILSWTSTNATSCSLYVNGTFTGWTGTAQASVDTTNLTTDNTYRIDCEGPNGTGTDTVLTRINPLPSCISATPDGDWAKYNGTRTVTANGVQNTTRVTFPIWSDAGQGDIIWYEDTDGSNGWSATENLSSLWNLGNVFVDVYLYNANYSNIWCDGAHFLRVKTGTVNVTIEGSLGWTMTGPNGFSQSGTGNINLSDLFYGNYTITPAVKPGYTTYINGESATSKTIELKD